MSSNGTENRNLFPYIYMFSIFKSGRNSPFVIVSGKLNEYLPTMLIWSYPKGDNL